MPSIATGGGGQLVCRGTSWRLRFLKEKIFKKKLKNKVAFAGEMVLLFETIISQERHLAVCLLFQSLSAFTGAVKWMSALFNLDDMETTFSTQISDRVAFTTDDGYTVIALQDIVCCEAEGNYTLLYLVTGENILISKSLKKLEDFLPADDFTRVHHHTIVGKLHIRKLLKNEGLELLMANGRRIIVSTRRKNHLLSLLKVF